MTSRTTIELHRLTSLVKGCLVSALCCALGCGDDATSPSATTPTPPAPGERHALLSDWGLFADGVAQTPAQGVIPYDVNAWLFSDFTFKRRFLWLPEGSQIDYDNEREWELPIGSVLIKTFSYFDDERDPDAGQRLLETRLLFREPERWSAHTYVWREDASDADRKVAGTTLPVSWIDAAGTEQHNDYGVPNTNECEECHGELERLNTLGLVTRQLEGSFEHLGSSTSQIDRLDELGVFRSPPPPASERPRMVDPADEQAPLEDRARAYLDANCSGCHRPDGAAASQSALWLDYPSTAPETRKPATWGECKLPGSAGGGTCGLTYDIVPGQADASILICRVESDIPKVRMPSLARRLTDRDGVELLKAWIDAMPPAACSL